MKNIVSKFCPLPQRKNKEVLDCLEETKFTYQLRLLLNRNSNIGVYKSTDICEEFIFYLNRETIAKLNPNSFFGENFQKALEKAKKERKELKLEQQTIEIQRYSPAMGKIIERIPK